MRRPLIKATNVALAVALALAGGASGGAGFAQAAETGRAQLIEGFANPPSSARPRVWWHWMNGNITEEGLTRDLEWMHRIGIGGVQTFDINLTTPQIVDHRLSYMSEPWQRAFLSAVRTARKLGIEFTIASSPGWSETGGPWVQPPDAMKKLVWSQVTVRGGERFAGTLPAPPSTTGPYQDVRSVDFMSALTGDPPHETPDYYRDIAVLAYPLTEPDIPIPSAITAGGAPLNAGALMDGRYGDAQPLPQAANKAPAPPIEIQYDAPQTIRSATIYFHNVVGPLGAPVLEARLEALDAEGMWQPVATAPLTFLPTTISFAPVSARSFRLTLARTTPDPGPMAWISATPMPGINFAPMLPLLTLGAARGAPAVAEISLSSQPRVNHAQERAGFMLPNDYYGLAQGPQGDPGIPAASVVDLTSRMKADGSLDWTAPAGTWRIVRLGYSLTGVTNHPATVEATGLEVDKYDGAAVRRYIDHYLDTFKHIAGDNLIGHRGIRGLVTDSTEVGPSNWTPDLVARFRSLRGYDPTPWLPALTGALVGSREKTEQFLYDFRLTLSELHTSEHYRVIAQAAHENGLIVFGEALEAGRPTLGDDLDMRRFTDRPMAAMWTYGQAPQSAPPIIPVADLRGAASVAHLYGQSAVAAESMTSIVDPWAYAPAGLRRVIDFEFANGINLPVIHDSAHQPVDDKQPGLALGFFGQFFNRHESWAELARPWIDYIARNAYLLQQGRNVADVAYFYGEEAPLTALAAAGNLRNLPVNHTYDFVNKTALLNALAVHDGKLESPAGASYDVLYLGGSSSRMTLSVLQRIADLARSGATIVGAAPSASPSLLDDRQAFDVLVRTLWSGRPVTQVGQGRVIADTNADAALAQLSVTPDFAYSGAQADGQIFYVHRALRRGDIYFLDNRRPRAENVEARFRVSGLTPELWRADSGVREPVSYRMEGDVTVVPLHFDAEESFFIVFAQQTSRKNLEIPARELTQVATVDGPWDVRFQPGRGAPDSIRLDALQSLAENTAPGVKYFSGEATYTTTFSLPGRVAPGNNIVLDLGRVGDIAEVRVNGKVVGTAWHAPFRVDMTRAAKPGVNRLDVRVADRWVNRLIGDAQPGAQRVAYTTFSPYLPNAPLLPSGLLGPVTVLRGSR